MFKLIYFIYPNPRSWTKVPLVLFGKGTLHFSAELFKRHPQTVAQARAALDAIVVDINTNRKQMVRDAITNEFIVSTYL